MPKITEHLEELEECLSKGQFLDSFAVRPVVRALRRRLEMQEALNKCYTLLIEAEADEINIREEMEKWERAYGHFLYNNEDRRASQTND